MTWKGTVGAQMRIDCRTFQVQKRGARMEECEDAYAVSHRDVGTHVTSFTCALADGASETSFSRLWAELLVRDFVRGQRRSVPGAEALRRLRVDWHERLATCPLPWYAEAKRDRGAYATLLGLTLTEADEEGAARWKAAAVGDTCLFLVRRDDVCARYPVTAAEELERRPMLLSTNEGDEITAVTGDGRWRTDDAFFLMTDALAGWFLRSCDAGERPWRVLQDVGTPDGQEFPGLIQGLRRQGLLRNDDVTLIHAVVAEGL